VVSDNEEHALSAVGWVLNFCFLGDGEMWGAHTQVTGFSFLGHSNAPKSCHITTHLNTSPQFWKLFDTATHISSVFVWSDLFCWIAGCNDVHCSVCYAEVHKYGK
jgi:hypothetical protein